ncbi:MAG: prepilin peptidase [Eubacteriales bacterium]|nr:prepilin peptidase [Eubacteriales bacterium]
MELYLAALAGLLGLCMGSFFNVCIYRIPAGKSVVSPPSCCGSCGHRLSGRDMIPILSWALSRGRCRHCGARYSARYALVEGLTAVLYVAVWLLCGPTWRCLAGLLLTSLLILIAFIDWDAGIIPNGLVLIGLAAGIGYAALTGAWLNAALGAVSGALPLLAVDGLGRLLYKKEGMGLGDVKMMAFVGLFLGWKLTLLALLLGVVLGAAAAAIGLAAKKLQRGGYMPFGPYLAAGAWVSFFWGAALLQWYLGFFV